MIPPVETGREDGISCGDGQGKVSIAVKMSEKGMISLPDKLFCKLWRLKSVVPNASYQSNK